MRAAIDVTVTRVFLTHTKIILALIWGLCYAFPYISPKYQTSYIIILDEFKSLIVTQSHMQFLP